MKRRYPALIASGLLAFGLVACGAPAQSTAQVPATPVATITTQAALKPTTLPNTLIPQRVSGVGTLIPARDTQLNFSVSGTIAEVLVKVGDTVNAGQPLARLDTRRLDLNLKRAEAALQNAKAQLVALDEPARPAVLAAGQAQVRQAEIAFAQAQAEQLQDQRAAQAGLAASEASLQAARDQLSATKTNAELALKIAVSSLAQAQVDYATAKINWEFVRETGQDPTNPESTNPAKPTEKIKNKLSDTQRQQYYDAFAKAEAGMRSAEQAVAQARVSYDNARQAELTGIQQSEQQVAQARASLAKLALPAKVDRAAAAQAALDLARANMAQLKPAPSDSAREQAAAAVTQAEVDLAAAQLEQEQATLRAPFDGIVASLNADPGEAAPGNEAVVRIVDLGALAVEVQISDLDIQRVQVGQAVEINLEGSQGSYSGRVSAIAPTTTLDAVRRSYAVRVALEGWQGLRPGMSVRVTILRAE